MADIFQMFFNGSELIGTVAFAISGAMLAIDRDLDLFGVLTLGVVTAVGGGIMRDVLLGSTPPNAFLNSTFVVLALFSSLAVFLFAEFKGARYWKQKGAIDRINNLLDAIGLGIFSVIGVRTAIDKGFIQNTFMCVFMGMMTGVGGGIIRDLLSMTIPAVLQKRIYAVASLAGSAVFYTMMVVKCDAPLSMVIGMLVTIVIRILATRFTWDLPKVHKI